MVFFNEMEMVKPHRGSGIGLLLYTIVFAGAIIMAFLSMIIEQDVFSRFLRGFSPILAIFLFGILGYIILKYAGNVLDINLLKPVNGKGLLLAASIASFFGLVIIILDTKSPLPADINIAFPESVFFYPAIGFLAEVVFHLLPLAILCIISDIHERLFGLHINTLIIWGLSVVFEPMYQITLLEGSFGLITLIGIHILLLNVAQLWLFKNYGFFIMYLFRVFYYLIWHIAWGAIRLDILYS